jgi:hypothetical protein
VDGRLRGQDGDYRELAEHARPIPLVDEALQSRCVNQPVQPEHAYAAHAAGDLRATSARELA